MKKKIVAFCASFVLVVFSTVVAYAGYSPAASLNNAGYALAQVIGAAGNIIVDVSPSATSYLYKVTIGFDSLSDLCAEANSFGVTCSLYYNSTQGVYVVRVQSPSAVEKCFDLTGTYGVLANTEGYVYTAPKEDTGNTMVNNTYNYNHTVINPSSPGYTRTPTSNTAPSYWEVIDTLKAVYTKVDFAVQYLSLVCDWLDFQAGLLIDVVHSLERSVAPALEAVNNNLISFKDSTVTGLKNLDNDVVFGINVLLEQLNVQNRMYSSVVNLVTNSAGIGSRLDSIISNGAVQVNTSPIEARLDKLISMYRKVNSVVLDTASISSGSVSSGSIRSAVGGELEDAVFWGVSSFSDKKFIVSDGTFTLNGGRYQIPVQPLGFTTGASVPASFNTTDTALMAGVWRTSGGSYCLSDTYNAATGEYVRRVGVVTYDGSEDWKMVAKDGCYLFYLSDPAFSHTNGNIFSMSSHFGYVPYNSAFSGNASDSAIAYNYKCTVFTGKIMVITQSPSVAAWKTWLKQQADAGTPWTVWYQDKPTTTVLDRTTIAIPEGDGIITGDYMRITGKYETYDSYTQTADIIAAINNIQAGVTPDLEPIVSRLDTLISQSSDSVVNVVNNNTYITSVYQLDDENDVADRSKEGMEKIGGVFKWLWKVAFKDAFGAADITKLDGLL